MTQVNEQQANWIADLLEDGHIHYEMKDQWFGNAFYANGYFVEESDDRYEKKTCSQHYTRDEFVAKLMSLPTVRFHRFLVKFRSTSVN